MNSILQNGHPDRVPLDERLDIFFREIELAVQWQRPSILLAVYPSEDVHAEAQAALKDRISGFGQQVAHFRGEAEGNQDISLFIAHTPDPERVIFFVDGLSCGSERDGFNRYRALNVSREYFVEKQIRIVFWLTEEDAVNLAHFAPDFWASRHRVIDFIESPKPDEPFVRALESAWQGQGEDKHMTDHLVDTHAKISLRETTQAGLPEWDGSTTAGVNLLLTLGIMYWRKGDHDQAEESLRSALDIAIKTQDKRLEAVCFNAIALVKTDLGLLDQAVEAYEQAIELAPEKTFIWGHLGNLYSQLGLNQEAVEAFLNTLEHNPVDSLTWNNLGNAYVNIGQADEAIDAYRKALELNEHYVEPWLSLGSLFKQQNLSTEAIKAYERVATIDPNHAQAWNELSQIYFELEAFDEAIEAYNIAIKLGTESGWSYCNLASAYARKDEFASAIPFYLKSIELFESDGDKAIAWNRLGDAYRQLKDYDHAILAYQNADKLADGNGSPATSQLSYLNSLIAGQQIVDELSTELLDQVRELTAAEDSTEVQDVAAAPESGADQPETAAEATPVEEVAPLEPLAESVAVSEPEIAPAVAERDVTEEAAVTETVSAETETVPTLEVAEAPVVETVAPADDLEQPVEAVAAEETAVIEPVSAEAPLAEAPVTEEVSIDAPGETTLEAEAAPAQEGIEVPALDTDAVAPADNLEPSAEAILSEETIVTEPINAGPSLVDAPVAEEASVEASVETVTETEAAPVAQAVAPSEDQEQPAETIVAEEIIVTEPVSAGLPLAEAPVAPAEDQEQPAEAVVAEEIIVTEPVNAELPAVEQAQDPGAPEIDLRNARIWNELGNIYFKVGAFDEALEAYNKAIELGLQVGLLYSNLGFACAHQGKYAEAIPLYEKSIELLGSSADRALACGRLAEAYMHMHEYAAAIAAYEKAIALDPANIAFAEGLNKIRDQLVQLEDTVDGDAEPNQTADAQAVTLAVETEADQDDDLSVTQEADEDESNDGVVAEVVAHMFEETAVPSEVSTGDEASLPESTSAPEAAEEPVVAVEAIVASDTSPAPTAETAAPEREAIASEAAPAAGSMREIDLKNAHIWNELGHIFARANSFDDAIDAYNKAIELDPGFAWPYSNLGLAHAQKGQFGEAIPLYQKSLELFESNKDKAISWNRLGDAYRQLNEYDNAIAAYQIADELNQHENEINARENLREVNFNQAAPIFSYLYGGSNDRV